MSKSINTVQILGHLGNDPESRTFQDGGTITNVSVATSQKWRDKQTGEQKEQTEWHRLVFRDRGNYKLAQYAAQNLKKGSRVLVDGYLRTRKWQDNNGQDRYTTEIIVQDAIFLDGAPAQQSNGQQQAAQQSAPAQQGSNFDQFDDDIPF